MGGLLINEKGAKLARSKNYNPLLRAKGERSMVRSETSHGSPPTEMQISDHAQGLIKSQSPPALNLLEVWPSELIAARRGRLLTYHYLSHPLYASFSRVP